jgi:hypothetical protein
MRLIHWDWDRLVFTRHARQRMAQRRIAEEDVCEAFAQASVVVPANEGNLKLIAKVRGRKICVVFDDREQKGDLVIISTWWMDA